VASGDTVQFALTNLPGAPATFAIVAGDGQSSEVGEAFPTPLTVEVRDAFDNPLEGVEVMFHGPSSGPGAELSATDVATGADGRAAVTAVANGEAGSYGIDATLVASGDTVQFALTNLPGEPADRIFASGFDESGGPQPPGAARIAGYDGHHGRNDAETVALDAQGDVYGNAYVTGRSTQDPGGNGNGDFFTIKYGGGD
jgi:hypothetical protein